MSEKIKGKYKDGKTLLGKCLSSKYLNIDRIISSLEGHEKVSVALLYLLLICAAYAPVVFYGRSLHASLYHPYGVLNDWPSGYEGRKPLNTFNIDQTHALTAWPLNKVMGDMYRKGEIPLWNPYQGAGVPLAGQCTIGVFFPYHILECISPVWTWDYFLLGRLWIAGFFTCLFLRLLGLSLTASLLGGIFYMFSGNLVWHINREDMVDTSMTVPVLLFCLEGLMQRQLYKDIALSAGAFSLVLLGQPEAALWVMLLGSCYIVLRARIMGIGMRKTLLFLVPPVLLGIGLSAPLIMLFLEMLTNSLNIHTEGLMGIAGVHRTWVSKLVVIFPTLFTLPTFYRIWPENGNWDFLSGYTGVLPVYLVFLGLIMVFLSKGKALRWELIFFTGFAVVILLKNFGVYPFVWIGYLPIINACWAQRWAGPAWNFSFAVAGAIGFEVLKRNLQNSNPGLKSVRGVSLDEVFQWLFGSLRRKVLFTVLTISLIVALALELSNIARKGHYGSFLAPSLIGGCVLASIVLIFALFLTWEYYKKGKGLAAFLPLGFVELWYAIPRGYNYPTMNQLWIPVAIGLFIIVLSVATERFRLALIGGLFFILSYLVIDACAYYGFPDRHDPFTEAPYVKYLKNFAGYSRVMGSEGVLMPNFASALGLQDVHYINTITPSWLHEYVERNLYITKPGTTSGSFWFTGIGRLGTANFPEISSEPVSEDVKKTLDNAHRVEREVRINLPFYSLLGLKYIVLPNHVSFNTFGLRENNEAIFPLIYHDEVNIYENPETFPRAFITHEVKYAGSYQEAQVLARELGFDLRHTAVLEEALPAGYTSEARHTDHSTALIKQYGPSKVIVEAHADSPGVLVLSDLYYPGWEAYVDGKPARLYRVDGVIRGVFVQEGGHTVVFHYSPTSFKYGLIAFALGLTVCCGCLWIGSRRFA